MSKSERPETGHDRRSNERRTTNKRRAHRRFTPVVRQTGSSDRRQNERRGQQEEG